MRLLRALTLGYVAILISTLAASLIAILVYLRRISCTLERVGGALTEVGGETGPLNDHLNGLHGAVSQLADQLAGVRQRVAHAPDRLAAIAPEGGSNQRDRRRGKLPPRE